MSQKMKKSICETSLDRNFNTALCWDGTWKLSQEKRIFSGKRKITACNRTKMLTDLPTVIRDRGVIPAFDHQDKGKHVIKFTEQNIAFIHAEYIINYSRVIKTPFPKSEPSSSKQSRQIKNISTPLTLTIKKKKECIDIFRKKMTCLPTNHSTIAYIVLTLKYVPATKTNY